MKQKNQVSLGHKWKAWVLFVAFHCHRAGTHLSRWEEGDTMMLSAIPVPMPGGVGRSHAMHMIM